MVAHEEKYPVSEIFTSVQGEGGYAGTPMTFVRLAGCTVGRKYPADQYRGDKALPIYVEQCTLYDGRTFPCDTDYQMHKKMSVDEIVMQIPSGIERVCVTGGEPMMHSLGALFAGLHEARTLIHLETSGTICKPELLVYVDWLTVSPKKGVLKEVVDRAQEVKLLVDKDFDLGKVPPFCLHPKCGVVYLQPVNGEHTVDRENVKRVVELNKAFPRMRISLQMHKVLEHYTQERVR